MHLEEEITSKDKLIEDYSTLAGAAVGVMVVRTREPYRALEALREHAYDKAWQFSVWKIINGWNKYDMDNQEANPKSDGRTAPIDALQHCNNNEERLGEGLKGFIYAMMWPHSFFSKNAPYAEFTQQIAEFTRIFSEQKKRLVLIAPPDYQLPTELEDMIVAVDMDLPTQEELRDIYDELVEMVRQGKKDITYSEDEVERILAASAGMTSTEFENTISRAIRYFRKDLPNVELDDFIKFISVTKAEIVKRSEVLELMPLGSMEDIGGLEILKEWIEIRKDAFTPEAREFGVDKPKGCALIGPPGTGKSAAAKAIAHSLGLPLIKFDVSAVFNQYVGSSESRVREALKTCAAMAPCVILLDEVDKAFDMNSGGGDSGVGKRILGAVLTFMQECNKEIFWVMSANRVGGLPPELLRKGRLDEVFSVTVPNEQERMDILRIHLAKRKQNPDKITNLESVVERSSGFVGAEIEAAVSEAILLAFNQGKKTVDADLLCAQFHGKPLSEAHAEQFQAMRDWAENNARSASRGEPPAASSSVRNRTRKGSAADTVGRRNRKIDTSSLDD